MGEFDNGSDTAQSLEQAPTIEDGLAALRQILGDLGPQALRADSPVTELTRGDYHGSDGDHSVYYVNAGGAHPQELLVDVVQGKGEIPCLKTLFLGTPNGAVSEISPSTHNPGKFDTQFFRPTDQGRLDIALASKLNLGQPFQKQVYRTLAPAA